MLPVSVQAALVEDKKLGRLVRWLKNLKDLVPEEGRGQARFTIQGEWSEKSWGQKVATLFGKFLIHWAFTRALSSFLVMGLSGLLFVQVCEFP